MHANSSQRAQIRNLLIVLTTAVVAAGGIASWMLYHYNPSGIYYAQNVLISPQLIGTSQTGTKGKVFFEGIQYIFPDGQAEQKLSLPLDLYEAFYNEINGEQSLDPVPEEALASFAKGKIARLVLTTQTNGVPGTFQEVHFAPHGDYYRVQLRSEGDEGNWAYYHHPHITQDVHKLFTTPKK